jgi:hypothetical protein
VTLKDVTPHTKTGQPGLCSIMAEEAVTKWIWAHAAELVVEGYVRLIVTDHVPTRIVGDRRKGR